MSSPSAVPASPDARPGSADGDGATAGGGPVTEPRYTRFRLPDPAQRPAGFRHGATTDPLVVIAPHVDAAFYRAGLSGAAADEDPVAHFHECGWREGRAPNPDFDTRYYLRTNPDVRAAGIDPLLHHVRFGQDEGRLPQRPGGARRALAEGAQPPAERRAVHGAPVHAAILDAPALLAALRHACLGRRGLVVALSHDRYIDITGGMQIFIADEQAQFNADRIVYLHIAPVVTRLRLAAEDGAGLPLQLTLDGGLLGLASSEDVRAGLAALDTAAVAHRLFIVHSLFGHRCSDVARMAAACRALRNVFWLHDHGTLCEGFNLLRNDATYCGAPDETSLGCRICVYGEGRAAHRAAIAGLFGQVAFDVMAPSEGTMALWRDRAGKLAWRSLRVHPHALLRPAGRRAARPGAVRIGFIGYPNPAKGWALFLDILRRARGRSDLAFYHFANPEALRPMPGITSVPVRVDRYDRVAMSRAIAAEDIDLVALLSPCPETFSYATREAFAAGADVVALADGGAAADAVRVEGRGVVFGTEAAVLRFFLDGQVGAYVALQREAGRAMGDLLACGTTATFDPLSDVPALARHQTRDPALQVVAGTALIAGHDEHGMRVFDLPAGSSEVRLVSRHVVPARLDPSGGDMRRLGVAIACLALDGAVVPVGDARRRAGWHGAVPADGWQWTNGDATLETHGARRLTIRLADALVYQRCTLIPEG